jgi:hypothetical protein
MPDALPIAAAVRAAHSISTWRRSYMDSRTVPSRLPRRRFARPISKLPVKVPTPLRSSAPSNPWGLPWVFLSRAYDWRGAFMYVACVGRAQSISMSHIGSGCDRPALGTPNGGIPAGSTSKPDELMLEMMLSAACCIAAIVGLAAYSCGRKSA